MVIPNAKKTEKSIVSYSEADLKGHILVNKPTDEAKKKSLTEGDEALLHEDYQLYSALTILKGMALAQR